MQLDVINSRVYRNPYQRLLYTAIESRYNLVSGTLSEVIAKQLITRRSIYHIHWEEALFVKCNTVAQALQTQRVYVDMLKRYISIGGKVVWTLHNIKPHESRFVQTLLSLRRELALLSHRILVHNRAALSILQDQTALTDLNKVSILPHPAYFNVYESIEKTTASAGQLPVHPRTILHFGMVREYKGIPALVRKLSREFMSEHQLSLHVCGEPLRADSFLEELVAECERRPDIKLSLRSVPVNQVAELLRSHAGLILPYHKVFSSGVAVLSLSLGIPTVAPNTSAMRELFPESSHHLLFNPRSTKDMRRAVLTLVEMSPKTRKKMAHDYIARANSYHPHIVSKALGMIYDELLITQGDDGAAVESRARRASYEGCIIRQSRPPALFQRVLDDRGAIIGRLHNNEDALLNFRQQLALELIAAAFVGPSRTGAADELILNSGCDAEELVAERARLDGAYAVQIYTKILMQLDKSSSNSNINGTRGVVRRVAEPRSF